jgi:hypothetical protein
MNKLANRARKSSIKVEKISNDAEVSIEPQPYKPYQTLPNPKSNGKPSKNGGDPTSENGLPEAIQDTKGKPEQISFDSSEENYLQEFYESRVRFNIKVLGLSEVEARKRADITVESLRQAEMTIRYGKEPILEENEISVKLLSMSEEEKKFHESRVRFNIKVLGLSEVEARKRADITVESLRQAEMTIQQA